MSTQTISIFEYDYLVPCGQKPQGDNRCTEITPESFSYLEQQALCQSDETSTVKSPIFLRCCARQGKRALQAMQYVGVLQVPHGECIEILPKIARDITHIEAQGTLLGMLQYLQEFRHIQLPEATIATQKMPLLEVFIGQFLQSVNQLVKRGLRSDYISHEENILFMKGTLKVSQHIRHNNVHRHRFYMQYDEYTRNNPMNRLIHTALIKVARYSRQHVNQKLCRELRCFFDDIPCTHDYASDFAKIPSGRGIELYRPSLAWTRLILENRSPLAMHGDAQAFSLLFPMEAVFEAYVAAILHRQLDTSYHLIEQANSKRQCLVKFGNESWFRLKPDMMICKDNNIIAVLDAKWKRLDNSSDKFGLSHTDFYQMLAYGHKYLDGAGDMLLIYPKTEQFNAPLETCFTYGNDLRLWIVPFDVQRGIAPDARLILPKELSASVKDFPLKCWIRHQKNKLIAR